MDEPMAGVQSPNHEIEMLDESDFMIVEDESHADDNAGHQDVEMDDHKSDIEDEEMLAPQENEEHVEFEAVEMIDQDLEAQEEHGGDDAHQQDATVDEANEPQVFVDAAAEIDPEVQELEYAEQDESSKNEVVEELDEVHEEQQQQANNNAVDDAETIAQSPNTNVQHTEEISIEDITEQNTGLESLDGNVESAHSPGEEAPADGRPDEQSGNQEAQEQSEVVTVDYESAEESESVTEFFDSAEAKEQAKLFKKIPIMIHLEDGNDVYYMYHCDMLDSNTSDVLIVDDTALHLNLEETFGILRTAFENIGESFSMDEELTFHFPQLGLQIGEDNCYSKELGIFDVLLMFSDMAQHTTDSERPDTLEIVLGRQPRFISSFNYLSELVRQGKGFEALIGSPDDGESDEKAELNENEEGEAPEDADEGVEEPDVEKVEVVELVDSSQADVQARVEIVLSDNDEHDDASPDMDLPARVEEIDDEVEEVENGVEEVEQVDEEETETENAIEVQAEPESTSEIASKSQPPVLHEILSSPKSGNNDPTAPEISDLNGEYDDDKAENTENLENSTPPAQQDEVFLDESPMKHKLEQQTHFLSEANTPKFEEDAPESRKRPLDQDLETEQELKRGKSAESLEV